MAVVALGGFVAMLYKVFALFSDMNINIKLLNQNFTNMNTLFTAKFGNVEQRLSAHGDEIDEMSLILARHDQRLEVLERR